MSREIVWNHAPATTSSADYSPDLSLSAGDHCAQNEMLDIGPQCLKVRYAEYRPTPLQGRM